MKKRLLSVSAICSLWGFLYAQTDVTNLYMPNPSFENLKAKDGITDVQVKTNLSNGLYGWELVEMSNFQVESEESKSSTGFPADGSGIIKPTDGTYYYFNRQGWAHNAGEIKTTSLSELEPGIYYVEIDYKAADYSNNNNANNNGTTLGMKVTDINEKILGENKAVRRAYSCANWGSNPGSDNYMVTADWNSLGSVFTVETATKITVSLVQNMVNSGRSDVSYDNLRLYKMENVNKDTPMDLTGLITNSNNYQLAGWTIEGGNTFHVNTWSTEGNTDGSNMKIPFLENWVSSGNLLNDAVISCQLDGLAPGFYKASALVRTINEAGSGTPVGASIFINGSEASVCDGQPINKGTFGVYSVEGVVTLDGKLKIGFKINDANFNWIAFKDVKLEYLGTDGLEDVLAEEYDDLRDQLTNMSESTQSDGIKGLIVKILQETENASTIDEYSSAITQLQNAQSEYSTLIERYNEVKNVITEHDDLLASSTSSDANVQTQYMNAILKAEADVNLATELETYDRIENTLSEERLAYIKYAEPLDGKSLDFTFMVMNPTCTVNEAAGEQSWIRNSKNVAANYVVNNAELNSSVYSGGGVEFWTSSGLQNEDLIWQTLTGLPDGAYEITAYAMGRNQSNNNVNDGSLQLFANEGTSKVTSNVWGEFKTAGLVNENGELKIGLKAGIDNKNNWLAIAGVHLNFIGNDLLGYYKGLFTSKNEEAKQVASQLEGKISSVIYEKLNQGIDGTDFGDDYAKYSAGADSLQNLINTAYSTTDIYVAFSELKRITNEISENSVPESENDKIKFDAAISSLVTEAEHATTAEHINRDYEQLEEARQEYVLYAVPVGQTEFDMTFLLKYPNVNNIPAFTSLRSIGWDSDLLTGNRQTNNINNKAGNSQFMEAWVSQSPMSSVYAIYQNVYLPAGIYRLTAKAFANGSNVYLCANEAKGNEVTSRDYASMDLFELESFTRVQPGYAKLGLKLDAGNTTNWLGLNDMKLFKKTVPETASLTEMDETETLLPGIYSQIRLNRTFGNKDEWNTFCVPFEMSSMQLEEYFDEVRCVKSIEKTGDGELTMILNSTNTIFPGIPYLVKSKTEGETEIILDNMHISNSQPQTLLLTDENNEIKLNFGFGSFVFNKNIPEQAFVLNGNEFIQENITEMPAFRSYLTIEGGDIVKVILKDDEIATSIIDISALHLYVDVYTLSGIKVKSRVKYSDALNGLEQGIYIINGKKVMK